VGSIPADRAMPFDNDEAYLRRALELANDAQEAGDVPVGAILVCGDDVIETKNERELRDDPTAHAEMLAIAEAARLRGAWRLSDATLYVTKEPCVMCAGAIVAARIARLVYGASDPKGGAAGSAIDVFNSGAVHHRVQVVGGVLEQETSRQLRDFFLYRARRPRRGGRVVEGTRLESGQT
jgi:tRNA(adenine34) deaminase